MVQANDAKSLRLLTIYVRLMEGKLLRKRDLSQEFSVTQRSIQRDVEDLRCFLADERRGYEIVYDRRDGGYRLRAADRMRLTNGEALAVCKILLESRSMCRDEMMPILDKLVECCIPERSRRTVEGLLAHEKYHYIEPQHGRPILNGLWEIGQAVKEHRVMEIQYELLKEPKLVMRQVNPVGIMFAEYHFYLAAFLEGGENLENPDSLFPAIYRIDRIRSFRLLPERARMPCKDRFEEEKLRKQVQFMCGGKLDHIRFRYTGPSIESVLDRLPTAKIVERDETGWTVEAEGGGKGIELWLRGRGEYIQED